MRVLEAWEKETKRDPERTRALTEEDFPESLWLYFYQECCEAKKLPSPEKQYIYDD